MPDNSPHGFPDGFSENSPSQREETEPQVAPQAAPRIAPPEGSRAARGAFSDADAEVEMPGLGAVGTEKDTAIQAPDVGDSYEPLGVSSSFSSEENPGFFNGKVRPDTPKDVELGLMAHLAELRQRLLYCAIILMAGMALTWNYSAPLQAWFADPIKHVLKGKGTLISTNPTGFFSITVQFSLVSALIITAPLLFWQVWLFIEPALTRAERRYSLIIVPFASALFFTGAALSYLVSPLFFKFFLAFQPAGVAANWDYLESILLMAKMLLAFGIMFQVPVIIIFLNKLGLLSRNVLIDYWRHAVIVIFVVAAIVTPTWDPVTLCVCATPPCLLYVLSIWLVKWL